MHHDPIVHGDYQERDPAPWPSLDEEREIQRFGIFDEEEGR
jgi:hypothetical protein